MVKSSMCINKVMKLDSDYVGLFDLLDRVIQ